MFLFIRPRCRAGVEHLPHALLKLFKPEWSVIARRWETEAVFNEHILTRLIARIHSAYLRHGHMRLVYDRKEIRRTVFLMWEIGEEREGRLARSAPVKVAGGNLNFAPVGQRPGWSEERGGGQF